MSIIFTTCICKASIPSSWPYCRENKGCLQFIIENENYLFDVEASTSAIKEYTLSIPIEIHKKLIQKDFTDLQLPTELFTSDLTPIDFLLPEITKDSKNLIHLQKHPKMIAIAKEIRRKNFTRHVLISFVHLSEYWALFLFESRNHNIWKVVLSSIIKSTFTPEKLLQHLDTVFRQNTVEYLKFYAILSTNQRLKREILIIEEDKNASRDNQLSSHQLNSY